MKISRRHVLRGLGGFTLAIPFLPSIEKGAHAAPPGSPRRFIALRSEHGGVRGSNMFPVDGMLTESMGYAGHTVRRGALAPTSNGGTTSLSPVLTAPSGTFTPDLVSKMNVLRGLDLPYYIGHHRGGTLGNYGDSDQAGKEMTVTCDQVLAWSNKFYESLDTNLMRTMVLGSDRMSWGYSNPQQPSQSTIEPLQASNDSLAIFDQIFVPPEDPVEKRKPIVDRVLEDYNRLRNGNRRLSARDKARLDDHVAKLDELERKLNTVVSCGDITRPGTSSSDLFNETFFRDASAHVEFWKLMNDVVVVALSCDTSRIVTMRAGDMWDSSAAGWFGDWAGDWHQEIAHESLNGAPPQEVLAVSQQRFFEHVFVDLAAKLNDVDDPNGGKLLDSCFMMWTHESGSHTHDPISLPVVTAGGANGWLRTGSYVDYQNRDQAAHTGDEPTFAGLLYHQLLGTAMQSMGLEPADYEVNPGGGYGLYFESDADWYAGHMKYPSSVKSAAGEPLPYLKA